MDLDRAVAAESKFSAQLQDLMGQEEQICAMGPDYQAAARPAPGGDDADADRRFDDAERRMRQGRKRVIQRRFNLARVDAEWAAYESRLKQEVDARLGAPTLATDAAAGGRGSRSGAEAVARQEKQSRLVHTAPVFEPDAQQDGAMPKIAVSAATRAATSGSSATARSRARGRRPGDPAGRAGAPGGGAVRRRRRRAPGRGAPKGYAKALDRAEFQKANAKKWIHRQKTRMTIQIDACDPACRSRRGATDVAPPQPRLIVQSEYEQRLGIPIGDGLYGHVNLVELHVKTRLTLAFPDASGRSSRSLQAVDSKVASHHWDYTVDAVLGKNYLGFVHCPDTCDEGEDEQSCACNCPDAAIKGRSALDIFHLTGLLAIVPQIESILVKQIGFSYDEVLAEMCHADDVLPFTGLSWATDATFTNAQFYTAISPSNTNLPRCHDSHDVARLREPDHHPHEWQGTIDTLLDSELH
ncbi:hypothetical protein JL720_17387 [Aureococcus anophagefferens]|nr:hypothetical protein JL720_17387 [Aureococcus anophagefferens]